MRSRRLLFIALLLSGAPLAAQDIALVPHFGTQLRYEQSAADRLFRADDALLLRARPGLGIAGTDWSLDAISDASVAVRRELRPDSATAGRTPMRPEALGLSELRLQYRGLPRTAISVGRQHLGMASAAITGDRDGEQTFDAARVQWTGFLGLSADVAYAWNSSSLWAADDKPLPETIPGENIFAQLNWKTALGTLSGYAWQIDQRHAVASDFRLLNQVYGARLSGNRKLTQDVQLNYSLGYVRQTGSLNNPVSGAPTYWQMGSSLDFTDLTGSSMSYRRFAANGISTTNGDQFSLATSATRGKLTVGAAFNEFKPLPDASALTNRNVRVSLGLIF